MSIYFGKHKLAGTSTPDDVAAIMSQVYPVGSIYLSVNPTNPGSLFGGTWKSIGAGRTLVGVDPSQTEFNKVKKTGGTKSVNLYHSHTVNNHTHTTGSHTLTASELPSHEHVVTGPNGHHWGAHFGNTTGGTPVNFLFTPSVVNAQNGYTPYSNDPLRARATGGGQGHSHGSTGGSAPGTNAQLSKTQSLLQPYFTVYMWERTA